jgi:hypothetical protein
MTVADASRALRLGRRGQLGCQCLTGQRTTFAQIGGFGDAAIGLGTGNAQPVGQRVCQSAAQLLVAGLLGELVDQCVPRHSEPPRGRLKPR